MKVAAVSSGTDEIPVACERVPLMRALVVDLCKFLIPFAVIAFFVVLTDPFNLLRTPSAVSEATKAKVAIAINPVVWKMNEFAHSDADRILLGDSRMGHIDVRQIERVSGNKYFNFWYGGGTLREMIDTFWFAVKQHPIREVMIDISFGTYDDNNVYDRTVYYDDFKKWPTLYFFDWNVLTAGYYDVYADWFHQHLKFGEPGVTREQFWKMQLAYAAKLYRGYALPGRYKEELWEVVRYCRNHHIVLSFVILPGHTDVQNMVAAAGLTAQYSRFKQDIAQMAVTCDCDYPNDLTKDRNNFNDPFHFTDAAGKLLVREIWTGDLRYCRILGGDASGVNGSAVAATDQSRGAPRGPSATENLRHHKTGV